MMTINARIDAVLDGSLSPEQAADGLDASAYRWQGWSREFSFSAERQRAWFGILDALDTLIAKPAHIVTPAETEALAAAEAAVEAEQRILDASMDNANR